MNKSKNTVFTLTMHPLYKHKHLNGKLFTGVHKPNNRGCGDNNDNNNNDRPAVPLQRRQAKAQTESDALFLPGNLQVNTQSKFLAVTPVSE